jgi:hypothetical protein
MKKPAIEDAILVFARLKQLGQNVKALARHNGLVARIIQRVQQVQAKEVQDSFHNSTYRQFWR